MTAPVPYTISEHAIKTRPRYRARILRNLILELTDRPSGESLTEIADEFWARYDYRPNNSQLATQISILHGDSLIKRIGYGVYKRISGAEYQRKWRGRPVNCPASEPMRQDSAPAAHAPTAASIFD